MQSNMTAMVLKYQSTGEGLKELVDKIAVIVYRYPVSARKWTTDTAGDFLVHFYPRIVRMLDKFQYCDKPFEAYLYQAIKLQMRTFAAAHRKRCLGSAVLDDADFWHLTPETSDNEAVFYTEVFSALGVRREEAKLSDRQKKRVLILALKGAYHLSATAKERFCRALEVKPESFETMIDEIRKHLSCRERRLALFYARRNSAFYRYRCCSQQLRYCTESNERNELTRRMAEEKKRCHFNQSLIEAVVDTPRHRDIARLLDLPKGSIDSMMHSIKAQLGRSAFLNEYLGRAKQASLPCPRVPSLNG